jgi:hypothetical protein
MEQLQASGEAFVTQAMVGGVFALRANILHFGTTETDLDALLESVVRIGSAIAS